MRRSLLLLLAVLLPAACLPARAQDPPALTWQTLPDALAEAAGTNRPALLYVRAAWCAPCARLETETFAEPSVEARLRRFARATLTFDDYDRTHRLGAYRLSEAEWAARLGAEATPALIVLSPNGEVLMRQQGFLPPAGLIPILDAVLPHVNPTAPR